MVQIYQSALTNTQYGIGVPTGAVARSAEEAERVSKEIGSRKFIHERL